MMEAEATLDRYGRWKSNQCRNKTKHIYIYKVTIQEPGLTARYMTYIVHIMGQWCVRHFHIHCSVEASVLEYPLMGISNASSE